MSMHAVALLVGAGVLLSAGQDGASIALDGTLFSERFRAEFTEMNDIFGEFGFEIEVIEGERPSLTTIIMTYGDPDRHDDVEVFLADGDRERPATLRFFYYREVGFGVLPDDPDRSVVRVKRREGSWWAVDRRPVIRFARHRPPGLLRSPQERAGPAGAVVS